MPTTLRALIVEDDEKDYQLLIRRLRAGGYVPIATRVETKEDMEAALGAGPLDIVFSDWTMPRFSGPAALEVLREKGLDLPFIIVSGTVGEETAVDALKSGAQDFLLKDNLARLIPAVERELREAGVRRQRDAMQEQLLISDRMASVGILAAGVAHEINTPLACLIANLSLSMDDVTDLAQDGRCGESLVEQLRDARDAAERLRRIVADLKIFSRTEERAGEPVDLRRVMESSIRMAWNEIRHRAALVKAYEDVPPVMGSECRIGQVFLNLLVNAAQAMEEGRADSHQIRIAVRSEGAQVLAEIADTGKGMSEEVRAKLFTPFFTTKPRGVGTGLGLTICQRIVNELGGDIAVESAPGKGTLFRIRLPACAEMPVAKPHVPTAMTAPARRGRVLVIDDEPMIASAISRVLAEEHDVTSLDSALDALRQIADGARFDVILCDLMMPRVTGMDFHRELSRLAFDQSQRIVFLTGGAFTPLARGFLETVSNHRLEKPFEGEELRAIVNSHVC